MNENTKNRFAILCAIGVFAFLLAACGSRQAPTPTMMMDHSAGHMMIHPTPPTEYASKVNPLAGKADAVSEGAALFQANCASCHGAEGRGDGPAGTSLDPKPVNLAAVQEDFSDAYLFWLISEGGATSPFNSLMPSWKSLLDEQQIWQVITFLRTLK